MAQNYKIKPGYILRVGRVKYTDETLTDKLAEKLVKEQRGIDRTLIEVKKTAKDESGSGKK